MKLFPTKIEKIRQDRYAKALGWIGKKIVLNLWSKGDVKRVTFITERNTQFNHSQMTRAFLAQNGYVIAVEYGDSFIAPFEEFDPDHMFDL